MHPDNASPLSPSLALEGQIPQVSFHPAVKTLHEGCRHDPTAELPLSWPGVASSSFRVVSLGNAGLINHMCWGKEQRDSRNFLTNMTDVEAEQHMEGSPSSSEKEDGWCQPC